VNGWRQDQAALRDRLSRQREGSESRVILSTPPDLRGVRGVPADLAAASLPAGNGETAPDNRFDALGSIVHRPGGYGTLDWKLESVYRNGWQAVEDVQKDASVRQVLAMSTDRVLDGGIEVFPPENASRAEKEAVGIMRGCLEASRDPLVGMVQTMVRYGRLFSWTIAEKALALGTGTLSGYRVLDRLAVRYPRYWRAAVTKTGQVEGWVYLKQGYKRSKSAYPPNRFLHLVFRDLSSPYGDSPIDVLALLVWLKTRVALVKSGTYIEDYATPMRQARRDTSSGDVRNWTQTFSLLEDIIERTESEVGVVMPPGYKLELMEAQRGGFDVFEKGVGLFDSQIAKALEWSPLMADQARGVSGSYAQTSAHSDAGQPTRHLERLIVARRLQRDLVDPLHRQNFPAVVRPPRIALNRDRNESLVDLMLFSQGAVNLIDRGLEIAAETVYELAQIPEPGKGQKLLTPGRTAAGSQGIPNQALALRDDPLGGALVQLLGSMERGTDGKLALKGEKGATALQNLARAVEVEVDPPKGVAVSQKSGDGHDHTLAAGDGAGRPQNGRERAESLGVQEQTLSRIVTAGQEGTADKVEGWIAAGLARARGILESGSVSAVPGFSLEAEVDELADPLEVAVWRAGFVGASFDTLGYLKARDRAAGRATLSLEDDWNRSSWNARDLGREALGIDGAEAAMAALERWTVLERPAFATLAESLRARCLTVAGATAQEIEGVFRQTLLEALRQGWNYQAFVEAVSDRTSGFTAQHLELVYRENTRQAYAEVRRANQAANPAVRALIYSAVNDSRTRPAHRALDGLVRPQTDPIWQQVYPPWEWGCRCVVFSVYSWDDEEETSDEDLAKKLAGFPGRYGS